MANFKIVISDPKSRKAFQKELDQSTSGIKGKKIGDKISGDMLGLQGYELEITGGSDNDGFPMRKDVDGAARKKVLLSSTPGFHSKVSGQRKRKSVRGNTISADISQVNTKVIKFGSQPIEKLLGAKEEKKPAEGEEAKPAETEKPAPAEEKPNVEEKTEEKPKEEAKTENKPVVEEPKPEEKAEQPAAEEKMGVKELDATEPEKKDEKPKEKSKEEKK